MSISKHVAKRQESMLILSWMLFQVMIYSGGVLWYVMKAGFFLEDEMFICLFRFFVNVSRRTRSMMPWTPCMTKWLSLRTWSKCEAGVHFFLGAPIQLFHSLNFNWRQLWNKQSPSPPCFASCEAKGGNEGHSPGVVAETGCQFFRLAPLLVRY